MGSQMYVKILEKLLAEWDLGRPSYTEVSRRCTSAVQEVKAAATQLEKAQQVPESDENKSREENGTSSNSRDEEEKVKLNGPEEGCPTNFKFHLDVEKYSTPLELACKGDSSKITVLALDGLQKLIAHGVLTGDYPSSHNSNRRVIDQIVETICSCYVGGETEEGVELQIIKGLLTVVTSQFVQVHGGVLLLILRTCFNIYVNTKSPINQTTSKAMLTQMLNSLITRMEAGPDNDESMAKGTLEDWERDISYHYSNTDHFPASNRPISVPSSGNPFEEEAELENSDRAAANPHNNNNNSSPSSQSNHLQKDAFLVFWSICKMGNKSGSKDTEEEDGKDEPDQKPTILRLHLVKSVLESCGPTFQKTTVFQAAVKQHVCGILNEVKISSSQEVYQLSLEVLLLLVEKFRNHIGDEIGKSMEELIITVLEQPTAPVPYKLSALKSVKHLFSRLDTLLDLFLDWELMEYGPFERLIMCICKPCEIFEDTASWLAVKLSSIECVLCLLNRLTKCLKKPGPDESIADESSNLCSPPYEKNEDDSEPIAIEIRFMQTMVKFLETLPEMTDIEEVDKMVQVLAQELWKSKLFQNLESADAIYHLIFATISTMGELSVTKPEEAKSKFYKDWFMKLNKPESSSWSLLSDECLRVLYQEIKAYMLLQQKSNQENICRNVSQPINAVVRNARRFIAYTQLHQSPVSYHEKRVRCVKKMFKVVAKPMVNCLIECLSMVEDDPSVGDALLTGLQNAIHVSVVLDLKTEREAILQALYRLSLIGLKQIKDKTARAVVVTSVSSHVTVDCGITKTVEIKTTTSKCRDVDIILLLLSVALKEGNYLQSGWLDFLRCISQLEASGLTKKSSSERAKSPTGNSQSEPKSWYTWAGSLVPYLWDSSSSKLDVASVIESIDGLVSRIFANSTNLDDQGIVEFLKALCQVSLIEITHPENPRSFVYEKIFEVTYANIQQRPCLHWCNMWQVLGDFFCHLACSSDEDVAVFAIDSLTKLVVCLLENETFGNFRFQSHYLKPFSTIMRNAPFLGPREHVLDSISKIIHSYGSILRSGYDTIFSILEDAITNPVSTMSESAFSTLCSIHGTLCNEEVTLANSYPRFVKCLIGLGFNGPTESIQRKSLDMLKETAKLVHSSPKIFIPLESNSSDSVVWEDGWLPIFSNLSSVVLATDETYSSTQKATAVMMIMELIKQFGDDFPLSWRGPLFDLLFSIYNQLKPPKNGEGIAQTKNGYNKMYCFFYIQFAILDLLIRQYDVIGVQVIGNFLQQLCWCIVQDHEQVALSGVQCLHQLVRMLQDKLSSNDWNQIMKLVHDLLVNFSPESQTEPNEQVHLELLKVLKSILLPELDQEGKERRKVDDDKMTTEAEETSEVRIEVFRPDSIKTMASHISPKSRLALLEILQRRLRYSISQSSSNISELVQLQEKLIVETYIQCLLDLYFFETWSPEEFVNMKMEDTFIEGVLLVFSYFVKTQWSSKNNAGLSELITTTILMLHHEVPELKFPHFASKLYLSLCDFLKLELEQNLSKALSEYFLSVIKPRIDAENLSRCIV